VFILLLIILLLSCNLGLMISFGTTLVSENVVKILSNQFWDCSVLWKCS